MTGVLVAGIGNLFLTDDGFGSEVARRLRDEGPPAGVRVVDYGIRGMHLAYDLLDGCAALVVVDALPGDGEPGELTVLAVGPDDLGDGDFDAHGMAPLAVLSGLEQLGGALPPTYVVGCRPADLGEGIGLTPAVAAAVAPAVALVHDLLSGPLAAHLPGAADADCADTSAAEATGADPHPTVPERDRVSAPHLTGGGPS